MKVIGALVVLLILLIWFMVAQEEREAYGPEISGTVLWGAVHASPTVLAGTVYADPVVNPL